MAHEVIDGTVSGTVISEEFDIPRTLLYRLVRDGRIPAQDVTKPYHNRRKYRFRREDVAKALAEHEATRTLA